VQQQPLKQNRLRSRDCRHPSSCASAPPTAPLQLPTSWGSGTGGCSLKNAVWSRWELGAVELDLIISSIYLSSCWVQAVTVVDGICRRQTHHHGDRHRCAACVVQVQPTAWKPFQCSPTETAASSACGVAAMARSSLAVSQLRRQWGGLVRLPFPVTRVSA